MIPKNADGKSQGIHKKFTSIRFCDFHTYYYSGVPMRKSVRIRTWSEQAFSISSNFIPQKRSLLSDQAIDDLCFKKGYFSNEGLCQCNTYVEWSCFGRVISNSLNGLSLYKPSIFSVSQLRYMLLGQRYKSHWG